ncbi:MAG: trans-2-enoyl-CoA reductase family protein [Chloroflexi bacterium]|nr:trans-2-enoyl-CoA reductase family protein [Chloroflexota bacterium]
MPLEVVEPRIRGFISLTAHPEGCAERVRREVETVRAAGPMPPLGNALVIGSSTGYGLASLLCSLFGAGAATLGVCLERAPRGDRGGSAGWYNLAEAHRLAAAGGRHLETVNGDAFSVDVKRRVMEALAERFGPLDLVVYSLAAPRRDDEASGASWRTTLKPVGAPFRGKSIDLRSGEVRETSIEAASAEEIEATVRVMGGDDWAAWMEQLREAGLLAPGARTLAYSYVGGELTQAIYRHGTIGRAKEHLEATAREISSRLARDGGGAWVSLNKAVVTQASAAIPAFALYAAILFRVMKERGTHEGATEQIVRLFGERLAAASAGDVDAEGRIRLDDLEMEPAVQARVAGIWERIATENLEQLSDYRGYRRDFEQLFGFGVEGVDYAEPTELDRPLAAAPGS